MRAQSLLTRYSLAILCILVEVLMPVVTLTIVNSGHNLLADGLTGADNPKATYFALGTGTSTPTSTQTKLDNEIFRKKVSSFSSGVSVGERLINCFISDTDAVGVDIEEVAVFGGNSATSLANSGKMIGRAKWKHNPKGNLESITLQLDATT